MKKHFFLFSLSLLVSISTFSQEPNWDDLAREAAKTEVYTPVPPIVTPGATPQSAPSDAIVLFGGDNLDAWYGDDSTKAAGWDIAGGIMTVNKKTGGIMTKQKFMDYQLHLEWRTPTNITGESQLRGNSGVFLAYLGKKDKYFETGYEVQVLDNYNNSTYVNGQCGSVYKQSIPLANACKKPGEWQTYDIIWKAPRFNKDGSLKSPAYVTVIQNGILVQDHTEITGQTPWIGKQPYVAHGPSPIRLQAHGDPSEPISYRNVWVRPL
ncbi:MAG: DUF1080 domain-containing protein [Bacteroidetes bacterium]|nr:DUF1080 domain-containing protein [Bacteroidota bacterium]